MSAYYNEIDPYAAQWLRNLIDAGEIAPGVVDERDIRDIRPDELAEFKQCHFFAGIGVWSHALRRAGWPDDEPVWTGSCPCQPFSAAGRRGGTADERHLWPHWHWLIAQRRPAIVLGEQVSSKDSRTWLDTVSADMEALGFAFGASDLCAAGFGGAHIRQRLYFVGLADARIEPGERDARSLSGAETPLDSAGQLNGPVGQRYTDGRALGRVDNNNNNNARLERHAGHGDGRAGRADTAGPVAEASGNGGLADANSRQCDGIANGEGRQLHGQEAGRKQGDSQLAAGGHDGRVADTDQQGSGGRRVCGPGEGAGKSARPAQQRPAGLCEDRDANAPMLGRHLVDWLFCRDGKWRPVEPGTFPLADAPPARVGRLRAYGNGLDAETATEFVGAVMLSTYALTFV